MDEHENHQSQPSDQNIQQAPPSLLPTLLARLGLDEPTRTRDTSLEGLRKALAAREWTERAAAVQVLAEMRDQETFGLLLSALRDEDGSVRAGAVCALGKRGDPQDLGALGHLEAALHDPEWHVRETAVYALGMLGASPSTIASSELVHDRDESVRRAALEVSGRSQNGAREAVHADILSIPVPTTQLPDTPDGAGPRWMPRTLSRLASGAYSHNRRKSAMLEEKHAIIHENGENTAEELEVQRVPALLSRPRRPWLRILEQAVAVLLVLGIVAGWLAVSRLPHSSSGATTTPSLGAPLMTIRGNIGFSQTWSADGRKFFYIQADPQKHTLKVQVVDVVSKRTTSYSVLDASWIASFINYNDFEILQGRYLLALRPQGKNLATMEIWDITRGRAVTATSIPAYNSDDMTQVKAPYWMTSADEQRFAVFSPDGRATIWDVANGQKLVTLEDKALYDAAGIPPIMMWYDHDQRLLFSNRSNQLEVWSTTTGARIFRRHDGFGNFTPVVSPNSKYMAWLTRTTPHGAFDRLKILDARSGQILHNYQLDPSDGADIQWLNDSVHLIVTYMSRTTPPAPSKIQMRTWNIITGQTTPNIPPISGEIYWKTDDGQYIVIVKPDHHSMDIWQISNGRHVASVVTSGVQANPYAIFTSSNRYMVIGERGKFNVWDLATGKQVYRYDGFTPFTVDGNGGGNIFWSPDGKYLLMVAWKSSSVGEGILSAWQMP